MKLVAAARVPKVQEAVINGRPFAETLVEVLYDINERLQCGCPSPKSTKEAQVIADNIFSLFVGEEVDKFELV
ncbi:ATP synthase gamma chain [Pyrus ussuriensis x Pyrus communis]|uniref:F-ATPase gamma subunit n=1 Tax=Pyrus ussuriensis x Pyrus communis TaxID=2448454 RepID=A0A5N5GR01_9ROSA|nr:ATP synthase gamma chain [Pyrus ussuriensis x Pyrus communis]